MGMPMTTPARLLDSREASCVGKTISLFDNNFDTASSPHRWELTKSRSYLRSSTQRGEKTGVNSRSRIASRHVLIGHRKCIFSFAQDITQRNRFPERYGNDLARYQALMATAIDGVGVIGTRRNLRDAR